jgi:hypothetical protein
MNDEFTRRLAVYVRAISKNFGVENNNFFM